MTRHSSGIHTTTVYLRQRHLVAEPSSRESDPRRLSAADVENLVAVVSAAARALWLGAMVALLIVAATAFASLIPGPLWARVAIQAALALAAVALTVRVQSRVARVMGPARRQLEAARGLRDPGRGES